MKINQYASKHQGFLLGLGTYFLWGFFPLYFKGIIGLTPLEILAHRIFWAAIILLFILTLTKRWSLVKASFQKKQIIGVLLITTILIGINWFVFLLAVVQNEVLQSSLAYFINPIISVLLGVIFLKERLNIWQSFSVFIVSLGLMVMILHLGTVPWISLTLAFSFGIYGLLRKILQIDPIVGLSIETFLLFPFTFFYFGLIFSTHSSGFPSTHILTNLLTPLSGFLTALPLVWFAMAAKQLKLSTLGFMQYITPTMHFILAVFLFKEPFDHVQLISFIFVWIGLALFSIASFKEYQKKHTNNSNSKSPLICID